MGQDRRISKGYKLKKRHIKRTASCQQKLISDIHFIMHIMKCLKKTCNKDVSKKFKKKLKNK